MSKGLVNGNGRPIGTMYSQERLEAKFAQLDNTDRMILEGLNKAEARLNATWNTMQVSIRVLQKTLAERFGITQDEMVKVFDDVGKELHEEAMESLKQARVKMNSITQQPLKKE